MRVDLWLKKCVFPSGRSFTHIHSRIRVYCKYAFFYAERSSDAVNQSNPPRNPSINTTPPPRLSVLEIEIEMEMEIVTRRDEKRRRDRQETQSNVRFSFLFLL